MKKFGILSLVASTALFVMLGSTTLSAEGMKCGAGKCGAAMQKQDKKSESGKCGAAKESKKSGKCGKGGN